MTDPVSTPSGHTYERKCIEDHIRRYGNDPITRRPLANDQLRPNFNMKRTIEVYNRLVAGN